MQKTVSLVLSINLPWVLVNFKLLGNLNKMVKNKPVSTLWGNWSEFIRLYNKFIIYSRQFRWCSSYKDSNFYVEVDDVCRKELSAFIFLLHVK